MKNLKHLRRRGLALVLALTMGISLADLTVFATDEGQPAHDCNVPLPQASDEYQYPLEYPGFLNSLMEDYPKTEDEVPEGGTWSAEGTWEDGTPVILSIGENGGVVFNEPTSPEALVTFKYVYQKEIVPEQPEESSEESEDEESGESSEESKDEESGESSEESKDEESGESSEESKDEESSEPSEESKDEEVSKPSEEPKNEGTNEDAGLSEGAAVKGAAVENVELTWKVLFTSEVATLKEGYVNVSDYVNLKKELQAGNKVCLTADVTGSETITISKGATLDLNGHNVTKTGNSGSIFHVTGGTFILEGNGIVSGGKGTKVKWEEIVARDKADGETAGGAVLVETGATFTMYGGTLTNNTATWGGAIAVARGGSLNIYGGTITNNTAASEANDPLHKVNNVPTGKYGGGGGIFCAGTGLIKPDNGNITISNNKTLTENDLGGGGIFVENKGTMKIYNAIVTGNEATGLGGGVAGCLHGKVTNLSPQTAAIYGNTANGNATLDRLDLVDHHSGWPDGFTSVAADYFCSGYSTVGSTSMNGGDAKWIGMARRALTRGTDGKITTWQNSGENVSSASTDPIVVDGVLALQVGSSNDVKDKADEFKEKNNVVTISGNKSLMHGGGIGCNGKLSFGEESFSYSTSKINIRTNKNVVDAFGADGKENGYTFQLFKVNSDGSRDLLATTTSEKVNGQNGVIQFNDLSTSVLFGESTKVTTVSVKLILKEVKGDKVGMTYDETERTITLTANRKEIPQSNNDNVSTGDGGLDVTTHVYKDTLVSGTVTKDGKTFDLGIEGDTAVLKDNDANFTNKMEYGDLTVTKTVKNVAAGEENKPFNFEVKVTPAVTGTYGDMEFDANGVAEFSLANGESKTAKDLPVGTAYTVTETPVDNFTASIDDKVTNEAKGKISTTPSNVEVVNERLYGSLSIQKKVKDDSTDSEGWKDREFTFTLNLPAGNFDCTIDKVPAGKVSNGSTITLKHDQTALITGIPAGSSYNVVETANAAYEINYDNANGVIEADKEAEAVVTNTRKTTNISVEKKWNEDSSAPTSSSYIESVSVEMSGGKETLPHDLTSNENWTKTWSKLPTHALDGTAYNYTVKETKVTYRTESGLVADDPIGSIIRVRSGKPAEDGSGNEIEGGWISEVKGDTAKTITNTWKDKEDLGKGIFTIIKKDSELVDGKELFIQDATFTLTKKGDSSFKMVDKTDGNGQITFIDLEEGTYILEETEPAEGYLKPTQTWEIVFSRKDNNKVSLDSVTPVGDTSEDLNNTWTWNATSGDNVGSMEITNDIIKGNISLTKALRLDDVTDDGNFGELKDSEFTFELFDSNGKSYGTRTINAKGEEDENGVALWENLRYGDYTIREVGHSDLDNYNWVTVNEIPVAVKEDGETYKVEATNDYTRHLGNLSISKTVTGEWGELDYLGTLWDFDVTLTAPETYVKLDKVLEEVKKVDGNAKLEVVEGKDTVTFTVQLKHGDTYTLEKIPVGTAYTVVEEKANQDNFVTTSNNAANTIENGVTSVVTFVNYKDFESLLRYRNISVNKVWVGDNATVRPASIIVNLIHDGEVYDFVELSASNGWSYTWTRLPEEGAWSVVESGVPAGYTSAVSGSLPNFTITNTYEEEEIPEEETPLTPGGPDEEEEIEETDVPLAGFPYVPEEDEEIEDPEVPLAPPTGGKKPVSLTLALLSGLGLAWLAIKRKRDSEE